MSKPSLSMNTQFTDSAGAGSMVSQICDKRQACFGQRDRSSPQPPVEVSRFAEQPFTCLARRRDYVPPTWRAMPLETLF